MVSKCRILLVSVLILLFCGAAAAGPLPTEQIQKLLAEDGERLDAFGWSVVVDGDTAVIGARDDREGFARIGSAYVFVRSGESWTQQAKLVGDDVAAGDFYGFSVAIDGDTALIGSMADDDNGSASGSAYVFVRTGEDWAQQAKLLPEDGARGDQFGFSVDLDGDTVAIGAQFDADNGERSGAAYVFVRSGEVWAQQAKLLADDGEPNDQFGFAVALDADTAAISASGDDDNGAAAGSAYIFIRVGEGWAQQAKLLPDDGAAGDQFGLYSIDLDGDTAVIGAPGDDDDHGSAYVFTRMAREWTQQAKLLAEDGAPLDRFGTSTAIDGNRVVIGAPVGDSAYVFVRSAGEWVQGAKLLADDGISGDRFGWSVALDDETALIGAFMADGTNPRTGAAYVFRLGPPDPVDLLNGLIARVAGLGLPRGIANALDSKLNAALIVLSDLNERNDHAAANILRAFTRQVAAQSGKRIPAAEADELISDAREIIALIALESSPAGRSRRR